MYIAISGYVRSLVIIGGKRVHMQASTRGLFSSDDITILKRLIMQQITNDESLAIAWYGKGARVGIAYRRRAERFKNRLRDAILICEMSPDLNDKQRQVIQCTRNICLSEALLFSSGSSVAMRPMLDALRHAHLPELAAFAHPLHLAIAYDLALNGKTAAARSTIETARTVREEFNLIGELQELWTELGSPARFETDRTRLTELLKTAREALSGLQRKSLSISALQTASRLANVVAQYDENIHLGLRWLEKVAMEQKAANLYTPTSAREYHTQRAILYSRDRNYRKGIEEARLAMNVSQVGTSYWFLSALSLVNLLLGTGQYREAQLITRSALTQRSIRRRSSEQVLRMRLRDAYARVVNGGDDVTLKSLAFAKHQALDDIILKLLFAQSRRKDTMFVDVAHSLIRHIDRSKTLRSNRGLWLLSRLLNTYTQKGRDLRDCRANNAFTAREFELRETGFAVTSEMVLSPLAVWNAIVTR